ncbi:hypothetical protein MYA_1004 [Burkholderia sp. KJ006]|nr:hypothetical protein MYA_1004 [Burkholderia sp. KJ006]
MLSRARWSGKDGGENCLKRRLGPKHGAGGHRAPANTASKQASTHRTLHKRAKPEAGALPRGARNASRAPTGGRCCGLGRSGEYRIQPDFPAWGVLPWFDVAKPRTLRGAKSGATP